MWFHQPMAERSQWLRVGGALAVGGLAAVGLLGIVTIGVLFLIAAAGVLLMMGGIRESEVPLVFAGASAAFLIFGVASLPYHPCHNGETLSDPPLPGGRSSCGGTYPGIYFIPMAVTMVTAVALAVRQRRRS